MYKFGELTEEGGGGGVNVFTGGQTHQEWEEWRSSQEGRTEMLWSEGVCAVNRGEFVVDPVVGSRQAC